MTALRIEGRLMEAYFDCGCDENYIHRKTKRFCRKCLYSHEECPDSRALEVLAAGLLPKGFNGIRLRDGQKVEITDLGFEWIKTQIRSGEATAFVKVKTSS